MKRYVICLLFLFLSGCSENHEINTGLELRSKLLQAEKCSFSVKIQSDYDQQIYSCSMECVADQQGNIRFTVTDPESIAGISGNLSASGGDIVFDDTILNFGYITEERLSPVSAPWILLNTLRCGYITSACTEEDTVRLSIDDSFKDDPLQLDIWLDSGHLPEHADILLNGRRILSLDVKEFQIV